MLKWCSEERNFEPLNYWEDIPILHLTFLNFLNKTLAFPLKEYVESRCLKNSLYNDVLLTFLHLQIEESWGSVLLYCLCGARLTKYVCGALSPHPPTHLPLDAGGLLRKDVLPLGEDDFFDFEELLDISVWFLNLINNPHERSYQRVLCSFIGLLF